MENQKSYPIKAVSKITGISLHVLRAWEKRYNAVVPIRTDTNRRLYTKEDVLKLKLLKKLTDEGYNVGSVANQTIEQLKELSSDNHSADLHHTFNGKQKIKDAEFYYDACLESVYNFKPKELEQILASALIKLSQPKLLGEVIIPLVNKIGYCWEIGEIRIYQEHMVSAIIKSFLLSILDSYKPQSSAPKILTTTPHGQYHEIGAIIAGVYAAAEGWDVTYLGVNLPAEEIVAAAIKLNSTVIALSILYPADDFNLRSDLMKFTKILPEATKLIVGGQAVSGYSEFFKKIGAVTVKDFTEFRNELRKVRTGTKSSGSE